MNLISVEASFSAWDRFGMLIREDLSILLNGYSESTFDEALTFIQENRKSFEVKRFSALIGEVGKLTKGTHMLDAKWQLSLAINHQDWCEAKEGRTQNDNHVKHCLECLLLDLAEGSSEEDFLVNLRKLK